MPSRCGLGTSVPTLAPFAAIASTSPASSIRRTHRQTTRTDCRLPSVAVDTCSTSTAFSDGSRRGPCVLSVTRSGSLRKSSAFPGTEAWRSNSTPSTFDDWVHAFLSFLVGFASGTLLPWSPGGRLGSSSGKSTASECCSAEVRELCSKLDGCLGNEVIETLDPYSRRSFQSEVRGQIQGSRKSRGKLGRGADSLEMLVAHLVRYVRLMFD